MLVVASIGSISGLFRHTHWGEKYLTTHTSTGVNYDRSVIRYSQQGAL